MKQFVTDREKVKCIILDEVKAGQVFYPSDIASSRNLDLKSTFEAVAELEEEKKLSPAPSMNSTCKRPENQYWAIEDKSDGLPARQDVGRPKGRRL